MSHYYIEEAQRLAPLVVASLKKDQSVSDVQRRVDTFKSTYRVGGPVPNELLEYYLLATEILTRAIDFVGDNGWLSYSAFILLVKNIDHETFKRLHSGQLLAIFLSDILFEDLVEWSDDGAQGVFLLRKKNNT